MILGDRGVIRGGSTELKMFELKNPSQKRLAVDVAGGPLGTKSNSVGILVYHIQR